MSEQETELTFNALRARDWACNHARWQVVRHRWGVRGVKTLVRVADDPPLECMREALDWLRSEAGCAEVWVNGKSVGGDWRPMGAWYEEARAEDGTQAVTLRVFQALRDREDGEAEGAFVVEGGCVCRVEHAFFWDVPEVAEVPEGSSGVAYEIQGLRRDGETGLFSYVLVRRERAAVAVGPWASHLDVFRERETALLLGVRDDGDGSVDEKVAGFLAENDLPLKAGDGRSLDVGKRKNDDCTTDVTVEVTREVGVPGAVRTVAEDAFARRVSVTDRAQESEAVGPEALGGEARCERTAGGRFDNTVVTVVPKEVPEAETAGTQTPYGAEASVTARNVDEAGADPDGVAGAEAGNDPATGEAGRLVRVARRLTAEGRVDVTVSERVERGVPEAEVTTAEGALARTERATHRNQAAADVAGLAGTGAPARGVIRRVTVAKTPGNLRDVTVETEVAKAADAGEAGGACARTIFEHSDTAVARNQAEALGEAPAAGGGRTYRNVSRLNADGTFDTEATVAEELEVDGAEVSASETAFEASETATGRNVGSPPEAPVGPSAANGNLLTRTGASRTPGGLWVATVTRTSPKAAEVALTLAKKDGRQVRRVWFRNQPRAWVEARAAEYTDGSASLNDFGLYDGAFTVTVDDGSGSGGGGRIVLDVWEATRQETRVQDEVDREAGVIRRVAYVSEVVEGVLNDNAQAAYAKCAGSVGPSSVRYLGGRTVAQGGRGYYAYSFVKSLTTKTEEIALSVTDGGGHVLGD